MLQYIFIIFPNTVGKHNLNPYLKTENKWNEAGISCEWRYYRTAAAKTSQSSKGRTQIHLQTKRTQPHNSPAVGTKGSSVYLDNPGGVMT